jgi:hypothetical protein
MFDIFFQYFDEMPATKGGKFEEFISEVSTERRPA